MLASTNHVLRKIEPANRPTDEPHQAAQARMPSTQTRKMNQGQVTEAICDHILRGKLRQGDPLRQIQLAEEFGVSQTVIRESLKSLEQHGLVTGAQNLGFMVREFGKQELADAYRVREVLEGLAARLCCRKASRDDIDHLRNLAKQIHAKSGRRSRSARSELEYQFHQSFVTISGNETLQRVSVGYRFVGDLVVTERDADELLEEHLAIVGAVAEGDEDGAERLARSHIARSAQSILDQG